MKTKEVKLNTEYRFENEIVKVVKRNKNSWVQKWQYGYGNKFQKIKHQEQMSFKLNNGQVVYADVLSPICKNEGI